VPLKVGLVVRADRDAILEGALHCTNKDCQCEFPIVDGIPLLVPQICTYVSTNLSHLSARRDLSAEIEGMLGDCCGPGTPFDATRLHLSSYAWDHYGDLDPQEPSTDPRPGSVTRVLERGLALAGGKVSGCTLDVGCSVGRSTFELARRSSDLILGVDLNFSMVQLAVDVMRLGVVHYPRRRIGLVYDRREFSVQLENSANVDFWVCDATALPFSTGKIRAAVCLNVLDCVASPLDLLRCLERTLAPMAPLILSTPYDWSGGVSPPATWIGGHSQRSEFGGAAEAMLRALLTPGAHPASLAGLQLDGEDERVPWNVRLHDRSTMTYDVHVAVAQARRT
jgi:SAM-dependent methyltransferase